MGDVPDFLHKFYNIEGSTINERKKNFYKTLKTHKFLNDDQMKETLKNITPRNYQEHIFYVDTLIYFKKKDDLLELLKSGNDLYVSKILKQKWFFEEVFDKIEPNALVYEYLPCLSHAVKKKFLSRIIKCWPSNKIDLLYDALDKKYGLKQAVLILHKCTPTKICNVFNDNDIYLKPNQVLNILNTDEELFNKYLIYANKLNNDCYSEDKVLHNLAIKNPKSFLELEQSTTIRSSPLGRRLTKKIFPVIEPSIIKESERYFRLLNQPALIRKLDRNFENVYKKEFPDTFKYLNMYNPCNRWLKYYPKSRKWNLFIDTCLNKFTDLKIEDVFLKFTYQINNLNPPKEIIRKWAEVCYDKQEGNYDEFLTYYEPNKAFALIKEKINVTKDIYKRQGLIELMIKSCKENEDYKVLELVLQYICFRHRNEDANFRSNILRCVSNNFELNKLNEAHWKCINEQIKILRIQKEYNFFVYANYLEKYIEFLIVNNLDYKESLIEYMNDLLSESRKRSLDLNNKLIEKKIYYEMGKIDANLNYNQRLNVLLLIINFSINNPDNYINLDELNELNSLIKDLVQKTTKFDLTEKNVVSKVMVYKIKFVQHLSFIDDKIIFNIMKKITNDNKSFSTFTELYKLVLNRNRNNLQQSLLLHYLDQYFESYPELFIINWCLKNEPLILQPYFNKVLTNNLKTYQNLDYKTIRYCSYLKYDEKVCNYYKLMLDDVNFSDKNRLVTALSILLPTDDFRKLIEDKYLPKKSKLDLDDKEMVDLYNLQCEVIKLSVNVVDVYKMLPVVVKFCVGDYFQSALKALYKCFYRSPERLLYTYIELLSVMSVTVRKHAIYLSCELLDKEHTLNILKNTKEENVSNNKNLFRATLQYFVKNPSKDILDKLIERMSDIDVNDAETLNSLCNITIPVKYLNVYLEKCWNFYESLLVKKVNITQYLGNLLKRMKGVNVSNEFVSSIIEKYGFNGDLILDDFIIELLKSRGESDRVIFFDLSFKKLSKTHPKVVNRFFECYIRLHNRDIIDTNLLNLFQKFWLKYFPESNYLKHHIELNIRIIMLSKPFSNRLIDYLYTIISNYDILVYNIYREVFSSILMGYTNIEKNQLLLDILTYKKDTTTCILVLELLDEPTKTKIYQEIWDIIDNFQSPIVLAYKNMYLQSH